jgi:hypothetical protein
VENKDVQFFFLLFLASEIIEIKCNHSEFSILVFKGSFIIGPKIPSLMSLWSVTILSINVL